MRQAFPQMPNIKNCPSMRQVFPATTEHQKPLTEGIKTVSGFSSVSDF
jgi:hypothetical protein